MHHELLTRWDEVDVWLREEARDVVRRRVVPVSCGFAFHDGRLSALLETPTFCEEDADLITDELCRFLPQLHADQLLVMHPGAYGLGEHDHTLWVLRAHIGERHRGWRTVLHPLPYDAPDTRPEPIEIDLQDPWSLRIRSLFDVPVAPIHDRALITPCDDRFTVWVHSEGPFGQTVPLFSYN